MGKIMTIIDKIVTIMLIGCGLFFIYFGLTAGYDAKLNGEETDCYDRYSNVIVGETCIVEGLFDNRYTAIITYSIIGFILAATVISVAILNYRLDL